MHFEEAVDKFIMNKSYDYGFRWCLEDDLNMYLVGFC